MIFAVSISKSAWSLSTRFVEVDDKVFLNGPGPYHFSQKRGVQVFLNSTPPSFAISEAGEYSVFEKDKKTRILALRTSQMEFYKKVAPLGLEQFGSAWTLEDNSLILTLKNSPKLVQEFLLAQCLYYGERLVSLRFEPNFVKESQVCTQKLKPKTERRIELAIIDASESKNSSSGLGVPASLGWRVDAAGEFSALEQRGAATLNHNTLQAEGNTYFFGKLSVKQPIKFETGSEVGIQQQGLFNRQATEWKNATTKIEIKINRTSHEETELSLSLNSKSRTAQGLIFEVEKLNQITSVEHGKWTRVLGFEGQAKSKNNRRLLGLSFLGSKAKSRSRTRKEVWLRLRPND